ncbi:MULTISPECIES: GntR family transcriptional regulator [Ralstonia solanacearum species complex]|uniref:GntR family transcriptional regulator n=4 Tax=Ralstonia solanacearum species complex TaxID=3116862 RepID=A0A0K1ZQL1_RALSL|nr:MULTISPECIES: GntR family transcriptional regulator [Ralstonia]AKZ28162.1 GntR family transcriptional regulator [Ralstonia solanacearum]APC65874.1 GntR family transcriptional regulator [Ralstonia solanacearum OE1-1]APF90057.1 GntR family transcriptional regulator [Ralstonia solanacearum FJAT-1458]ARS58436.1 GntR family transcriptional regulator [Ralstonia solanacearum FJAT-91]AGH86064.1 Transcriptional regulator, GntR family [Ralstonia pseudosolanacearum FQY_4]
MPDAVVPLYHQIYVVLRQQILEGKFGDGPMPGEIELARQFGASRVTMRRVFDYLVKEGLVRRHRGMGTFVVRPDDPEAAGGSQTLLQNIIDVGERTSAVVVEFEDVMAPPDEAKLLEVAPGTPIKKLVRVRHLEDTPMALITTWLPLDVTVKLTPERLTNQSLLRLIEASGVRIDRASQVVSARLADVATAQYLDIAVGAPLLSVQRIVRAMSGRPVQLLQGLYRPDRYEYRMELSRVGEDRARLWIDNAGRGRSEDEDEEDEQGSPRDGRRG